MIFFLFKHIICFQDLIQPAAVSDEKSCIQLPAGGQIIISWQKLPSTPPVLKIRFFPYISGRGNVWALS